MCNSAPRSLLAGNNWNPRGNNDFSRGSPLVRLSFDAMTLIAVLSANCLSCWQRLNGWINFRHQFRSQIEVGKSTCSVCPTCVICYSHTVVPTRAYGSKRHNSTQRSNRQRLWKPSIKSPSTYPNHAHTSRHRLHFQGHRRRSIASDWSSYIHAASDRVDSSSCLSSGRSYRRRDVLDFDDQEDEGEVNWNHYLRSPT